MTTFRTIQHLGYEFELTDLAPASTAPVGRPGPGAGAVTIEPLTLAAGVIPAGASVELAAQVSGRNIAFVYVEAWWMDEVSRQAYGPVHREHLAAGRTREVGGQMRPEWEAVIPVASSFRPAWPLLTDGRAAALACAAPERYGAETYGVRGIYTAAGSSQTHAARLFFDASGDVQRLLVRPGSGNRGAWRAATLAAGDRFAPAVRVLTPGPDETWAEGRCLANVITVGDQPFRRQVAAPLPGRYLAGVLVQDLDGGLKRRYVEFSLTE